jgi:hypothetical protein
MMLTMDNAAKFLIETNLITTEAILWGDLSMASAARRNRNLRATRKDGLGYLVKQPDDPMSGGLYSLRCEAAFYAFCQDTPEVAAVQALLPQLMYFDYERGIVALELLVGAQPLWGYCGQFDVANFPVRVVGSVGQALGIVHRAFRLSGPASTTADARLAWLRRDLPWILQVHKPGPELLAGISPANYEILKILQAQEGLSRQLDGLRPLWRPETIIHNDIKSDNILVTPAKDQSSGAVEVRLVDWELVQIGDPAWDVAGVLQDFVLFWILSMTAMTASLEDLVQSARYPLPVLQAAIRAFGRGYRSGAGLESAEGNALFARAVRFSAARLIQSAYEMAQTLMSLPAQSVLLLQISANLLADPEAGQMQLYGLFQEVN